MRLAVRLVTAAMLVVCSLASHIARAEPRKVLLVSGGPTPFSARLAAEIEAMGFEVAPATSLDEPGLPPVVAAARIVESPLPRRVELWIVTVPDGTFLLSNTVAPSPDADEATQAVRASEQLRAFLQPLREPGSVPAPAPAPFPVILPPPAPVKLAPPPPRPSPHQEQPRFDGVAAVAVPFQPGGPGADVLLEGRVRLSSSLGVGGVLAIPVLGSTVRSGGNSASVRAGLLGAEVGITVLDPDPVRFTALAGVAVAWVRTQGDATPPYTSHADDAVVGVPLLGAEVAARLTETLRVVVGGRAGVALPRPAIRFAERDVATWGSPLVLLSAGIGISL